MQYYYSNDGNNQQGPVDLDGLRAAGVTQKTLVWREGMAAWTPAGQVAELASLFASLPAAPEPTPYPPIDDRGVPLDPADRSSAPTTAQSTPLSYQSAPQYPNQYQYQATSTNGMAVASMVLGIIGLPTMFCYCIGYVPAILAIIFGHISKAQIRRGNGTGDGMALAGMILGYTTIALSILMIAFFFALGVYSSNTRFTPTPTISPTVVPSPQKIPSPPRIPTPTFPKPPTIPTH